MGAIALQEFIDLHGLRVPDDVSLVGFDNVSLSGLARISLTTVEQGGERHRSTTVPVELVVRGSTGAPSQR